MLRELPDLMQMLIANTNLLFLFYINADKLIMTKSLFFLCHNSIPTPQISLFSKRFIAGNILDF